MPKGYEEKKERKVERKIESEREWETHWKIWIYWDGEGKPVRKGSNPVSLRPQPVKFEPSCKIEA